MAPLEDSPVLHWHGDTFDLPKNAVLLANSALYPNQAFSIGPHILALQFHIEVATESLEKWLIGHTCELRNANIDIPALRLDNEKFAPTLENKASQIITQWMATLTNA